MAHKTTPLHAAQRSGETGGSDWPRQAETSGLEAAATSQLPDDALLHLLSEGDLHALAVIYDRHIDAAWTVAVAFSANESAAERAVSAAFLHLWHRPEPLGTTSLAGRLLSGVRRESRASTD